MPHSEPQQDPPPAPIEQVMNQVSGRDHKKHVPENHENQGGHYQHEDLDVGKRRVFRFQPDELEPGTEVPGGGRQQKPHAFGQPRNIGPGRVL